MREREIVGLVEVDRAASLRRSAQPALAHRRRAALAETGRAP
jgi:hypothetical protein